MCLLVTSGLKNCTVLLYPISSFFLGRKIEYCLLLCRYVFQFHNQSDMTQRLNNMFPSRKTNSRAEQMSKMDLDEVGQESHRVRSYLPPQYLCIQREASLVAQRVKCLPAMRETQVQSLGQEDPLEKEMATHSSTLAWKIPWTEEPCKLQSMGSQRVGHD